MPRGDGTGPFGIGPLKKQSRSFNNGEGRCRNMNPAGDCPGRGIGNAGRNVDRGSKLSDGENRVGGDALELLSKPTR